MGPHDISEKGGQPRSPPLNIHPWTWHKVIFNQTGGKPRFHLYPVFTDNPTLGTPHYKRAYHQLVGVALVTSVQIGTLEREGQVIVVVSAGVAVGQSAQNQLVGADRLHACKWKPQVYNALQTAQCPARKLGRQTTPPPPFQHSPRACFERSSNQILKSLIAWARQAYFFSRLHEEEPTCLGLGSNLHIFTYCLIV